MEYTKTYKAIPTTDYSRFKRLEGNRKVLDARVKKIISSIEKVGYIPSPIIVNEKWQVIDGQGRLEAVKKLGLPIYYMQIEGLGIEECIAMNINLNNWSLEDYIGSYAETGNMSYMYMQQLIKAYKGALQNKVIISVVTGKKENNTRDIKEGYLQCDSGQYNHAVKVLSYLKEFSGMLNRLTGHTEYYYMALAYCYDDPEVDNKRMIEKMTQLQSNLIPVTTMKQALEMVEEVYNNRIRGGRVYIGNNYQRQLEGKYSWYGKRHGKKN